MKRNHVCLAIIPRGLNFDSNDQVTTEDGNDRVTIETSRGQVPTKIENLLNEYKEIIVEDIPDGLPLVRSISHCMDLIPRTSYRNKAPYRLTPTENEELNKRVHQLLQKGLIR